MLQQTKIVFRQNFLGLESGTAIETRFLESPLSEIEQLWQEIKQLREKIDGLRQRVDLEDLEVEYIEISESNEESSYTTTASISSAENMEPMNGFY